MSRYPLRALAIVLILLVSSSLILSLPSMTSSQEEYYGNYDGWWNKSWEKRIPVVLTEPDGIAQPSFVIDLWMDFSRYDVVNATNEIRVTYYDNGTGEEAERPVQVAAPRCNETRCFETRVLFLTKDMAAYESQTYYIYFENQNASTPSELHTNFNPEMIKNRLMDPVYENNNYDLNGPTAMEVDDEGKIYIVDRGNHRVQIFDRDGEYLNTLGISRESGADDLSFSYPTGIAVADGKIYVADTNNHRVQIFGTGGNYLHTIGITGETGDDNASLDSPKGVAVGDDGKIYVADCGNQRIQVFDGPEDDVSDLTIGITGESGTSNSMFNLPYGIALGAEKIYVSDSANHRVQIFEMNGTWTATIGQTGDLGSTNAHLFYPYDIDVGENEKIYVVDHKNHRVQIFDPDGSYSDTIGIAGEFGSGNEYLNNPTGIAVSGERIFVADNGNNRIQIFEMDGSYVQSIGSGTGAFSTPTDFNDPRDVAVGSDGRIFVADRKQHRIQIFDSNYTYLQTIGTAGESGDQHTHLSGPYDVDIGLDKIAVADSNNNRIQLFDLDGTYIETLTGTGDEQFIYPCGVKIDDTNSKIYVADTYSERVQIYDFQLNYLDTITGADPRYTDTGMPEGNITFKHPYDVEIGPNGLIYVLDTDHQCIQVFYPNNHSYSHTIEGSTWNVAGELWEGELKWACGFDIVGNEIYLADTYNHRLRMINIDGEYVGNIGCNCTSGSESKHFSRPRGVSVGPNGNIYVADADNNRIQIFDQNGLFLKSLSTTGLALFDNEHLNNPDDATLDDSNNIYIVDTYNHRVQVYDPHGDYKF
ncbi:MAG: 6-bladed beta-propeller, partial [Thermoplasmata archaeon]|nr:6-bladed beta-propeller [Thermoplasmata archaeon]